MTKNISMLAGSKAERWVVWLTEDRDRDAEVLGIQPTQSLIFSYGGLAQLIEHLLCTQRVRSLSLLSSTICRKRNEIRQQATLFIVITGNRVFLSVRVKTLHRRLPWYIRAREQSDCLTLWPLFISLFLIKNLSIAGS